MSDNVFATTEPLFYVGYSANSVTNEIEMVCIFSKEEECNQFLDEELKKPFRMGVRSIQKLTMNQIWDSIRQDALRNCGRL